MIALCSVCSIVVDRGDDFDCGDSDLVVCSILGLFFLVNYGDVACWSTSLEAMLLI